MSINNRAKALETIQERIGNQGQYANLKVADIFASNVFTLDVMKEYLEEDIFEQMEYIIETGAKLDRSIADKVANSMRIWAMEKGTTHYTHWFQPLTGLTAEKHDAFFTMENGKPIAKFSGDNLAQAEPDASSFPSGGIRNTFEARGYTAWDPSSPAFIFENQHGRTLCIPTIFVSYTGEALDYKAPLLRSMESLNKAATDVCNLFDKSITRVTPTLGVEQEYFLVDEALFNLRPDLVLTGRTVIGASPAKGQQLDDHYFGSIQERAFGFMKEFETEAYKVGIPITTRHNEVAPGQFECAPIFEEQNVAVDHNQLLMDLADRVARKHKFRCLLHEKPFAGVNGSGKHNNWSLGTNTGKNLLSPGKNPKENLMFLTFFTCTIKAVHQYSDLLRASIASASNDHRLGANEAPPAIISVFIGSQLSQILDEIEKPSRKKKEDVSKAYLKMGINKIPEILLDNTDRNRTSPFAFTGNKFELRAVGSTANNALPMTTLNTMVAKVLTEFHKTVERKTTRGKKKNQAILEVIRQYITDSKVIRFEGDGYSGDWVKEAKKRGLNNIMTTPRALDVYTSKEAEEVFSELGVLSKTELLARHEIFLENYLIKLEIENSVLADLARNHVMPAALKYQKEVLQAAELMAEVKIPKAQYSTHLNIVRDLNLHIGNIYKKLGELDALRRKIEIGKDTRKKAIEYSDKVRPLMEEIRHACDSLEMMVSDEIWPLPKYRELLFMR